MTTTYRGKSMVSDLILEFEREKKVIVFMPDPEEGVYDVAGNSLTIVIRGRQVPDIILRNVQILDEFLTGEIQLSSDLDRMINRVKLTKQASRISDTLSRSSKIPVQLCSELDLPEDFKALFKKYDLTCPIVIPKQASYYEYIFIKQFIKDVIETFVGAENSEVDYVNEGRFYLAVERNQQEASNILKPLFEDPDKITFREGGCPFKDGVKCALNIFARTNLKPEFIRNASVDFDRLWSAIVNVTDSKDGVTLDKDTIKTNGTDRYIEGEREVYVPPDSGYLVVERLIIEVKDPSKNERPGEFVEVGVKSRLWKRKRRSYRAEEINQGTSISGGFSTVRITGSDSPILKRIAEAVLKGGPGP